MNALNEALARLHATVDRRTLGRYELRYRLAAGGMGAVYLARQHGDGGFGRWVAVKTTHEHVATDPQFVTMFLDEARLAARIDHPNVCRVTDYGTDGATSYLVMEYMHGEPLSTVLAIANSLGGLPPTIAARIIADAARGLHAAHELVGSDGKPANVIHRDVSPQNIYVLYDGFTKVLDFGIAQWTERVSERTSNAALKGKIAYMAPEQFRRDPIDRRVDVFALGVVLWEATVGLRLFKAESEAATIAAVLAGAPPPSSIIASYPPSLEAIVLRALAPTPSERFDTAEALARALEGFIASSGAFVGAAQVSDYLRDTLADRRAWRDTVLSSTPTIDSATPLPERAEPRLDTTRDEPLRRAIRDGDAHTESMLGTSEGAARTATIVTASYGASIAEITATDEPFSSTKTPRIDSPIRRWLASAIGALALLVAAIAVRYRAATPPARDSIAQAPRDAAALADSPSRAAAIEPASSTLAAPSDASVDQQPTRPERQHQRRPTTIRTRSNAEPRAAPAATPSDPPQPRRPPRCAEQWTVDCVP